MKQEDRRVKRTRKLLHAAFTALILEKGYDTVTIQDITDRADIGYRTYYRHYADKDALLVDVLQATVAEMRDQVQIVPPGLFSDPEFARISEENGRSLFQYVQANSDLYRILFQSGDKVLNPSLDYAQQETQKVFNKLENNPFPDAIVAHHLVSSTFSLIEWWLDNSMPHPPEEMGTIWANLIILPVRQAVEA